jgi:5-methylcytosine-specific restriction endonuclease McrA
MKKGELKYERRIIQCACGCGQTLIDRDSQARPRIFIKGHNKDIGNVNKGKHPVNPMKGKHYSDEDRKKYYAVGKNKGHKMSPESLVRMSNAHKGAGLGRKLSEEQRKNISVAKKLAMNDITRARISKCKTGIKPSKETIEKRRIKMLKIWSDPEYKKRLTQIIRMTIPRGEKSSAWRGGKSFEPYTKEFNKQFKLLIRTRDAFTCQLCGLPEREYYKSLTVHHIDYDKTHSLPNNLITLCCSCNTKVNENRNYWTMYFRELLNQKQLRPNQLGHKLKSKLNVPTLEEYKISCR